MTTELPRGSDEPARKASDRTRDCSHLIGLLADQLEALEQGDLARVRELGLMRDRLAGEMRDEHDAETPLLSWLLKQLEEGLNTIESWTDADRRTRDEVAQLQNGSLPLVRGLRRRPGGGNYLNLEPGNGKLDVRL